MRNGVLRGTTVADSALQSASASQVVLRTYIFDAGGPRRVGGASGESLESEKKKKGGLFATWNDDEISSFKFSILL